METISAFANGEGGVIIFGVDDDGQIVGLDGENLPRSIDRLATLIGDWIRPPIDCSPEAVEIDGAMVVIVRVPAATETPYGVGHDDRKLVCYVRRGHVGAGAAIGRARRRAVAIASSG